MGNVHPMNAKAASSTSELPSFSNITSGSASVSVSSTPLNSVAKSASQTRETVSVETASPTLVTMTSKSAAPSSTAPSGSSSHSTGTVINNTVSSGSTPIPSTSDAGTSHANSSNYTSKSSPANPSGLNSVLSGSARATGTSVVFFSDATREDYTSTITSTIHPVSTFSTPVSIAITNSVNGRVVTTAPPFVTTTTTSRAGDGTFTTITYVVANPTGVFNNNNDNDKALTGSSFFRNHGAVAGGFIVLGIVVATLAACIGLVLRRRRGLNHRRRLQASIAWPRPLPHDPFENPRDSPPITNVQWGSRISTGRDGGNPGDTTLPSETAHAVVGNDARRIPYEGPFRDYHEVRQRSPFIPVGLAISTDPVQVLPIRSSTQSMAQSSPSLYPASLPREDADSLYEQEVRMSPARPDFPTTDATRPSDSPYQPLKAETLYQPLTPPPSVCCHSRSKPPSPAAEAPLAMNSLLNVDVNKEYFKGQLKRILSQTLLDVRPRENFDNVPL